MARGKNGARVPSKLNAEAERPGGDEHSLAGSAAGLVDRSPTEPGTISDSLPRHVLANGTFTQNWTNLGLITVDDNWSNVPSIVGYRGDGLAGAAGADPRLITGSSAVIDVNTDETTPDTFATGGVAEFHIANPTIALTGSGTARAPYIAIYLDSTGSSNIRFSCNLRDLDGSTDNAIQQINIQYRTDGGAWINVPGGYFADVTTAGSATQVTAVNIVLPAGANNAAALEIRIMTVDATGNDEWVGIDDIAVSAVGALSIDDVAQAEGNAGSTAFTFTVTRTGGTSGAVGATWTIDFTGGADAADLVPAQALTGTVAFADGETSKTITIDVQGDTVFEPNESFTVTLSAATGGATIGDGAGLGTITNDDAAPNIAPTTSNLQGDTITYTEQTGQRFLDVSANAAIVDPDSANFNGGSLRVQITTGLQAGHELIFFVGNGRVSLSSQSAGATVFVQLAGDPSPVAIGTLQNNNLFVTDTLILFNSDNATPARVQELLRSITYNGSSDAPVSGTRTIEYTLNDGDGGSSTTTSFVNVVAVNDAPTVSAGAGQASFSEGVNVASTPVAVAPSLTVSDPDNTTFASATASISANFEASDVLAFVNNNSTTFGNIVASYDSVTGVLTLTSAGATATRAQFQSALRAVTFTSTSEEPGTAARTVSFVVNDGGANSAASTRQILVQANNDAPSGTSQTLALNEDQVRTLSASDFGFSDVDGDAFAGVRFGTAPTGGTLFFDADGAGGNAPVAITTFPTITYTDADFAAGRVTFVPTLNLNGTGTATITFSVVDDGGTVGAGQNADLSPNTLTFNIAEVNDAPAVVDATQDSPTILEDVPLTNANAPTVASLFGASFSDAADAQQSGGNPTGSTADSFAGIAIVANGSSAGTGQWQYWNGASWVNIGTATQDAAKTISAATLIRFEPAPNFNGPAPTLTAHLIETGGIGITNGGTVDLNPAPPTSGGTAVYSSGTVVLSQAVTSVNDAPVIANFTGDFQNHFEGDGPRLLDIVPNAATVTDLDSSDFNGGSLNLAITAGGDPTEDVLGVLAGGLITTQAIAVGNTVSYNGTVIGTYTADGTNGSPLTIALNAAANATSVAALISRLTYFNTDSDNPTAGGRAIDLTLDDGDGNANGGDSTGTAVTIVTVVRTNDPPSGADNTIVMDEDGTRILAAADFGFTDPAEGHAFAGVVLTTLPASGDLYLNGVAITVAGTFINIADINGNLLTYRPDPNGNGTGYASFTFQVRDNGGGQSTDQSANTMSFNVTSINDAPSGTDKTVTIVEDSSYVLTVADFGFSDVDGNAFEAVIFSHPVGGGTLFINGVAMTSATLVYLHTISSGNVVFVPAANATGTLAGIRFTVRDDGGFDNGGQAADPTPNFLSFNVTPLNDAPVVDLNAGTPGLNDTNLYVEGSAASGLGTDIVVSDVDDAMLEGATVIITNPVAGDLLTATLPLPGGITIHPSSTATMLVLTGTASAADYASALGQLGYSNTGDDPTAGGTSPSRTITITVNDGDTNSAPATMTITVLGQNDPALVTGDISGSVTEAGGVGNGTAGTPTDTGDLDASDVDGPQDAWQAVSAGTVSANGYGSFALTASGVWTYTLDDDNAAVQALNGAATLTDSFTALTADGTAQVVTITINAQNDVAVVSGDATGTVTEAGGIANGTAGTPTDSGDLDASDVDNANDAWAAAAPGTASANGYGSYALSAAGVWTYTLDNANAAVQALNVGGMLTDSFTALTEDGTAQLVTVTINGTNDAAVITGDASGAVTEAGAGGAGIPTDSGDLDASDVDNANDAWAAVAAGAATANGYGSYALSASGVWTYTLDNANAAVQALNGAATLTDSFTALTADGTAQLVTITIGAQNDTAAITGDAAGSVTEAGAAGAGVPSDSGDLDAADLDNNPQDDWQAVAPGGTTANGYGSYALSAAGVWTYTLDNADAAVQALNVGGTLTDSFTALTQDGTAQLVTVTITGANDAAVITGDASGSVVEAGGVANGTQGTPTDTGDLDASDVDNANDAWAAVAAGGATANGYGSYALSASGVWVYTLDDNNAAVQALTGSATLTDTFTALTADGTAQLVTVTIGAQFDSPQMDLNGAGAGTSTDLTFTENDAVTPIAPDATVADVDTTNFNGASLIVRITNGINGQDVLSVINQGNGPGQVGYSNGVITYEGVQVADLLPVIGAPVPTLDIRFLMAGTVPQAVVEAVLRAIGYSNLSEDPSTTPRNVTFQLGDGEGPTPGLATATINVLSVNDEPASANVTIDGVSEDDPYTFQTSDFPFSDSDGDAAFAVVFTSLPADGDILLNGVAIQAGDAIAYSAIAQGLLTFVPDADESGSPYTSFTFRVRDDGGTANGGDDLSPEYTATINVAPDNFAPAVDLNGAGAGIDASVTYDEDSAGVSLGTGIVASDPDEGLGDMIESATITLTDALAGDALTLSGALPPGFLAVTTPGAGTITITITGSGSGATYSALLDSILYSTSEQNPIDLSRTVTVTVNDGTVNSAVATSTITIVPSDDAPVAQPDAFATDEASMLSDSVFPDNGSGPDEDVDGPLLSVSAVNGSTTDVGQPIVLASGALLTLNMDGTFDYDPNGAFNQLPGPASGASNLTATDSFDYTLTGGNTVTVTIVVSGLDSDGDVLLGTPGADNLDGGIGSDTMTGFGGDDVYLVDDGADIVIEVAGGGNDTIRTSVDYALGAGLSVETMTTRDQAGLDPIDLTGNELDNRLEGNAGVNSLTGNGGQDQLYGHGGDDLLIGGAGNDLLDGGAGIDIATFAADALGFADTLVGWVINSADGNDLLQSVEIAVDGTGERNLLVGSTGFATIQAAFDAALAGDTVRLASGNYTGTHDYDVGGLVVIAQPDAVQNVTYTTSSGLGIIVYGANAADSITTDEGDDYLIGGGGNDTLAGGAGNDTYYVDGGDLVLEADGEGNDRIATMVSYALAAGSEVELLEAQNLADTNALDLTGNELANTIIGNSGANILIGGAGNDVLIAANGDDFLVGGEGDDVMEGGFGNDTYYSDGLDTISEDVGGGTDRVAALDSVTLTAGAEIELLEAITLSDTTAIELVGNEFANTIIANNGDNLLDGKDGNDVLLGLGGADTFAFTTALGANNVDLIKDFDGDTIALAAGVFSGLGLGTLSASAFTTGGTATTTDHRIVYNQATGQLFYDADGSGGQAQVLFATLEGVPTLTASDFIVI